MKKLITASDIRNIRSAGQTEIYTDRDTLITPAAKDLLSELGMTIKFGTAPQKVECATQCASVNVVNAPKEDPVLRGNEIDPNLISQIVKEVLASIPGVRSEVNMVKEADPSGVRLIRGSTVECEPFNTGNPKDKVGIKEILTIKESPNMATGFMTVEETAFSWDLTYDEIDYVIDGTLEITVGGKTYQGRPGDVFFIPRNTTVTFASPDKAKFFFVTYPANWAELSNYEK